MSIFLAPVSATFKTDGGHLGVGIETNKARATPGTCDTTSDTPCFIIPVFITTDKTASAQFQVFSQGISSLTVDLSLDHGVTTVAEQITQISGNASMQTVPVAFGKGFGNDPDADLTPSTAYFVTIKMGGTKKHPDKIDYTNLTTQLLGNSTPTGSTGGANVGSGNGTTEKDDILGGYHCLTWMVDLNIVGCVAEFSYFVYFMSAKLTRGAAIFLDFFMFFSITSAPYKSPFVSAGWGIVRDVMNIFFIIGLLFIAIRTILGMGHDNKKMIAGIVIVALLINFSMFFTNVIIDSSNILAHVFYNRTEVKGEIPGASGQRSVANALVDQINPQALMDKKIADNLDKQDDNKHWYELIGGGLKGGVITGVLGAVLLSNPIGWTAAAITGTVVGIGYTVTHVLNHDEETNAARALLLILIALFINIMVIYIFISIGLLFLWRTIGLTFALILAPFAFVSYFIPGMKSLAYVGWDEWLKEVIKWSFMAPLFAFFLYIIIKMGEVANLGSAKDAPVGFMKVFLIILPFAFMIALLLFAKKITVKLAGEGGALVNNIGKVVGGAALGVGLGAAAGLGRSTIGKAGSLIENSEWVKKSGAFGRGMQNFGQFLGKGSFDARGVKVAGKDLASATGMSLGKAQEGGFTKAREDQVKKRQERAERLKVGEDEKLKQDVYKAQASVNEIETKVGSEIEHITEDITEAGRKLSEARASGALPPELARLGDNVAVLRAKKDAIKNGTSRADYIAKLGGKVYTETATSPGETKAEDFDIKYTTKDAAGNNLSLKNAKKAINNAEHAVAVENYNRMQKIAKTSESLWSNFTAEFTGGSMEGNREAANKIRSNIKPPKKKEEH